MCAYFSAIRICSLKRLISVSSLCLRSYSWASRSLRTASLALLSHLYSVNRYFARFIRPSPSSSQLRLIRSLRASVTKKK